VTLVGAKEHDRPAGVETDTARFTVPVNPFSAVRVIVEVPEEPTRIWDGVTALAVMLKSACGVKVTLTVRVRVPLVPLTVTVKVTVHDPPAVSVAVLGVGRVTLAGDIVFVQPEGGVVVMVRAILPV
jgi:hypothetical protein